MKRIIVPVDGSEFSSRAIGKAVEIARGFDSEILLFNGIEDVNSIPEAGIKVHHDQGDRIRAYSKSL